MIDFILAIILGLIIVLIFYSFPWIFAFTVGIIIAIILVWYVAKQDDYYIRNDITSTVGAFFVQMLNPIRQLFGRMPIWIIPDYSFRLNFSDGEYWAANKLDHALSVWKNIKNTVRKLDWPSDRKQEVLRQAYAICENIVIALWKLRDVVRTSYVINEELDRDSSNRQEVLLLWHQVTSEIDNAIQLLTALSVQLTKSRVSNTIQVDESINLIERIKDFNQELEKITRGTRYVKSTSSGLWSYTIAFVIVITAFTISSRYVPEYAFAITVSGSLLGFLVIGILQLRESGKISEGSFVQIVTELIKNISLIKRSSGYR